jgi:hypothetical protein
MAVTPEVASSSLVGPAKHLQSIISILQVARLTGGEIAVRLVGHRNSRQNP